MSFFDLDHHPLVALVIAIVFGALGYYFLEHQQLLWGAFSWWACGVNCHRIMSSSTSAEADE